jgi:hypothetical protein
MNYNETLQNTKLRGSGKGARKEIVRFLRKGNTRKFEEVQNFRRRRILLNGKEAEMIRASTNEYEYE